MGIELKCSCGKKLVCRGDLAGKSVHCPVCGSLLRVSGPQLANPMTDVPLKGYTGQTPLSEVKQTPSGTKRCDDTQSGRKWPVVWAAAGAVLAGAVLVWLWGGSSAKTDEMGRARDLMNQGRLGEALATYERVLEKDSSNAEAIKGRDEVRAHLNRKAAGVADRRKGVPGNSASQEETAEKSRAEADRKAAEEEASRKAREEEAARKAQEEEAARKVREKAAQKAYEDAELAARAEAAKKAQEQESARKAQEEETARKAQEQAAKKAAEAAQGSFVRLQSTVKALVIMTMATGDMVGQAMDITATAATMDAAAAPPIRVAQPVEERTLPNGTKVKGPTLPPIEFNTYPVALFSDVGKEMALSLQEAVRGIQPRFPEWRRRIDISFGDKYSPKDGGSAGTAFSLVLMALLQGYEIDPQFAVTGDISVNGAVRKIGGVMDKIKGAIEAKCLYVAVPLENATNLNDMVLINGNSFLWQIQILTPNTLDEAIAVARKNRGDDMSAALGKYAEIQEQLKKEGIQYTRSAECKTKLKEVVGSCSYHASADLLLQVVEGRNVKTLTVNGAMSEMFRGAALLVPFIWAEDLPIVMRDLIPKKSIEQLTRYHDKLIPLADKDMKQVIQAFRTFVKHMDVLADRVQVLRPKLQVAQAFANAGISVFSQAEREEVARIIQYLKSAQQPMQAKLTAIGQNKDLVEKSLRER